MWYQLIVDAVVSEPNTIHHLHSPSFSNDNLKQIMLRCPLLERVVIVSCSFLSQVEISSSRLKTVVLSDCLLIHVALACPNLKTLDLTRSTVFLKENKSTCFATLRKLFLCGCPFVTPEFLARLAELCPSLALLNCSNTNSLSWSNDLVQMLTKRMPRLRRLYINHSQVEPDFDENIKLDARISMTAKHIYRHL